MDNNHLGIILIANIVFGIFIVIIKMMTIC